MLLSLALTVASLFGVCWTVMVEGQILPDSFQRWTHQIRVETGVEVKWNSEDPSYLTMEVSAPTKGYVGVGFSPSGGMQGSDIMIGWVDKDGIPHVRVSESELFL
jgi:hypothetical protein